MMSKIPNTIYLQWHGDGTPDDPGPVGYDGVTWSTEPVFEHDVRYTRGGWISVDERLPENKEKVLIYDEFYGGRHIGTCEKIDFYGEIIIHWETECGNDDISITYWQPLPDPPAPA
jgi:hypothetical protein